MQALFDALPASIWLAIGFVTGALLVGLIFLWRWSRRENLLLLEAERIRAELDAERRMREEVEAAREQDRQALRESFGHLSNRALQQNSAQFLRLAEERMKRQQEQAESQLDKRREAVGHLVKPVADALEQTRAQLSQMEKERKTEEGALRQQIKNLAEGSDRLRSETHHLVEALRRPNVSGQWGEISLQRLVELAGMTAHVDYEEQVHQTTDDGAAVRPDMVIHLPENRDLVVDVKTPLDAYLSAVRANNDQERSRQLKLHARNVKKRVSELGERRYWSQFENAPDFVILFIPGEQFLTAALTEEPELLDDALRRQVMLATPTSLVALLKAIAYSWRQVALIEHARELRQAGEAFYDRLGKFIEHMGGIGKHLGQSVDAYNKALGSLDRRLVPATRRLAESGIEGSKKLELPDSITSTPRDPDPL